MSPEQCTQRSIYRKRTNLWYTSNTRISPPKQKTVIPYSRDNGSCTASFVNLHIICTANIPRTLRISSYVPVNGIHRGVAVNRILYLQRMTMWKHWCISTLKTICSEIRHLVRNPTDDLKSQH